MASYPATLKAHELVAKVHSGAHRIAQVHGCRGFHIATPRADGWNIGAKLNTNAARAACKRLTPARGVHMTFWHPATTPQATATAAAAAGRRNL